MTYKWKDGFNKLTGIKCENCESPKVEWIDRTQNYDRYVCYKCGFKFKINY
jgi:DNA-directed RNA polymerase subunit RPC12/RpoP